MPHIHKKGHSCCKKKADPWTQANQIVDGMYPHFEIAAQFDSKIEQTRYYKFKTLTKQCTLQRIISGETNFNNIGVNLQHIKDGISDVQNVSGLFLQELCTFVTEKAYLNWQNFI